MIDFYYVDEKYIQYLKKTEKKIPAVRYDTNEKFVCGIVLKINDLCYYAPISHNTSKYRTSMLIKGRDGRTLSSIRFCFMFPAPAESLTKLVFSEIEKRDRKYADLLREEYAFCASHEKQIRAMALKVYEIGSNPGHVLYKNCCDFKKLEGCSFLYQKNT